MQRTLSLQAELGRGQAGHIGYNIGHKNYERAILVRTILGILKLDEPKEKSRINQREGRKLKQMNSRFETMSDIPGDPGRKLPIRSLLFSLFAFKVQGTFLESEKDYHNL